MLNKRGKIMAIGFGIFFIAMIVWQQFNGDKAKASESYYDTYSSNNTIKVEKKQKLAAIKSIDKDATKESESYRGVVESNKKDKAFSFYREILMDDEKDKKVDVEIKEDITEIKPDKKETEIPQVRVVYKEKERAAPAETKIEPEEPRFTRSGFYGAENVQNNQKKETDGTIEGNSLKCEIYQDQTITDKQFVLIRVLEDGYCDGRLIPRNTFIEAKAGFENEVVQLTVSTIKLGAEYLNVDLLAYSNNGTRGLMAPGSVNQEIAKDAKNGMLGNASTTLNLPGGLGGISINSAKKKVRENTIPFPDGTQFYLK